MAPQIVLVIIDLSNEICSIYTDLLPLHNHKKMEKDMCICFKNDNKMIPERKNKSSLLEIGMKIYVNASRWQHGAEVKLRGD